MGNAGMLVLRLEDPQLRAYAEGALHAAQSAAELTKELLAFAHKGRLVSVPVNMHTCIADVALLLSRSLDKRIQVRQQLQAEPATVMGDPAQLQNVLLNLAINARDAMPNGGELRFATALRQINPESTGTNALDLPPGRYLHITVTDTGIGMAKDTIRRIFEPFFTTKEPGKGTGIGLASAYATIQRHRGAVTVESEPGCGTVFSLFLPLAHGVVADTAPAATPAPCTGRARLLVVEDEPGLRDMLGNMLRQLGYAVTLCANGEEALRFYHQHWQNVDLVVLDLILPDLSGRQVFTAMRGINPDAHVLLASGYSLDGDVQAMMTDGARGFLPKPFAVNDVASKIGAALE